MTIFPFKKKCYAIDESSFIFSKQVAQLITVIPLGERKISMYIWNDRITFGISKKKWLISRVF
jgi:hypothetical protein